MTNWSVDFGESYTEAVRTLAGCGENLEPKEDEVDKEEMEEASSPELSPVHRLDNIRIRECDLEDYPEIYEDEDKEQEPGPEDEDEAAPAVGSKRKHPSNDDTHGEKHILVQGQLDIDLRKAAGKGSLKDVKRAVSKGGRVNSVCRRHQRSPLIYACRRNDDYQVAEQIVRFLIAHGASVYQSCNLNSTPLHWACEFSSLAVVKFLLGQDARVEARSDDRWTPLFFAAQRQDDEAHQITRLLLLHCASSYISDHGNRTTPLLLAAEHGTTATLNLLLNHCHIDMNGIGSGDTALIAAARNIAHGATMIPLVLAKHSHEWNYITKQAADGHDALLEACKYGNTEAIKVLKAAMLMLPVPMARAQAQATVPFSFPFQVGDPLGTLDEAASLGYKLSPGDFTSIGREAETLAWVSLRRTVWDLDKVWHIMRYCDSYKTWHWVGMEMLNVRHPRKGTTLLHVAAKRNLHQGLSALCDLWANPFIRDARGRIPRQRATDTGCLSMLTLYGQQQQPRREVIRWYGPCFLSRAQTWMLCVLRWRLKGVRVLPKDVAFLIVRKLMTIESV